jgi:hypothetical protein
MGCATPPGCCGRCRPGNVQGGRDFKRHMRAHVTLIRWVDRPDGIAIVEGVRKIHSALDCGPALPELGDGTADGPALLSRPSDAQYNLGVVYLKGTMTQLQAPRLSRGLCEARTNLSNGWMIWANDQRLQGLAHAADQLNMDDRNDKEQVGARPLAGAVMGEPSAAFGDRPGKSRQSLLSSSLVGSTNRGRVLQALFDFGPTSRAELRWGQSHDDFGDRAAADR